jgi:hypothetical protein
MDPLWLLVYFHFSAADAQLSLVRGRDLLVEGVDASSFGPGLSLTRDIHILLLTHPRWKPAASGNCLCPSALMQDPPRQDRPASASPPPHVMQLELCSWLSPFKKLTIEPQLPGPVDDAGLVLCRVCSRHNLHLRKFPASTSHLFVLNNTDSPACALQPRESS